MDKPTIVVLLAPADAGTVSARISAAARAELPHAVPACAFEFVAAPHDPELLYSVMPLAGTAGSVAAPGALFDRPPSDDELAAARGALDAIVARVRAQKLS